MKFETILVRSRLTIDETLMDPWLQIHGSQVDALPQDRSKLSMAENVESYSSFNLVDVSLIFHRCTAYFVFWAFQDCGVP